MRTHEPGAGWTRKVPAKRLPGTSHEGQLNAMKIEQIETLACDAGWRNYHFLKLVTDDGVVGWSEFDEAFGPPGLATVIDRFADRLIGEAVHDHERLYATLAATVRPAPYGLSAEASGAIENALLDAQAKALGENISRHWRSVYASHVIRRIVLSSGVPQYRGERRRRGQATVFLQ